MMDKIPKEEELDFELTALALREAVMSYFKDFIGGKYILNPSIRTERVAGRGGRWADRRENEVRAVTHVCFGDHLFATMSKSPDTIQLHDSDDAVVVRLKQGIRQVIETYLPNVILEE